ncbi:MAG: prephenate dehydrogenase/arogenate dehydrogenase family protein, partial [Alphaproteobacteria bacterium]
MTAPHYQTLALIGVGLVGSSIARVARERKLAGKVLGFTPDVNERDIARGLNLADTYPETLAASVAGADLVVLAAPVGAFGAIAKEIGPHLKPGATVTDVGSVKTAVVRDVAPHMPKGVHFIPGHPIAGTEQSGPKAGFATLFDRRWCILTPLPGADAGAVARLRTFWEALGSSVEIMDP